MGVIVFATGIPNTKDIDQYRKAKLKMLTRDFRVYLTDEEKAHAETLKTEIAIDNFCITMIRTHY